MGLSSTIFTAAAIKEVTKCCVSEKAKNEKQSLLKAFRIGGYWLTDLRNPHKGFAFKRILPGVERQVRQWTVPLRCLFGPNTSRPSHRRLIPIGRAWDIGPVYETG